MIKRMQLLLLVFPFPALACIATAPTAEEAARGTVLVGYVTGENYPDYEAALIRDGKAQYPLLGRHVVRVTPVEALKGELLGPLEIETDCYADQPVKGERVIVVLGRVVSATPEYEQALKDEIAKRQKRRSTVRH